MSDLERPLPASLSALAARDQYLAENGFSTATYDAKGSKVTVFGIDLYRPMSEDTRRAIRRHDLHHVVTGYGTDYVGEAEVSAWEVGRGLRGLGLYTRMIVCGALLLFTLLAPRRVWRAFQAGKAAPGRGCLFAEDDYEALLKLSLGELRARVGIPPEGLSHEPRRLHARAPKGALPAQAS